MISKGETLKARAFFQWNWFHSAPIEYQQNSKFLGKKTLKKTNRVYQYGLPKTRSSPLFQLCGALNNPLRISEGTAKSLGFYGGNIRNEFSLYQIFPLFLCITKNWGIKFVKRFGPKSMSPFSRPRSIIIPLKPSLNPRRPGFDSPTLEPFFFFGWGISYPKFAYWLLCSCVAY